jgi:hypothetical protein
MQMVGLIYVADEGTINSSTYDFTNVYFSLFNNGIELSNLWIVKMKYA